MLRFRARGVSEQDCILRISGAGCRQAGLDGSWETDHNAQQHIQPRRSLVLASCQFNL